MFSQARKLPPAHTLAIRRGQPVPSPREYWDVRFSLDNPIGVDDACEELRTRPTGATDPEQVSATDESSSVIRLVNRMIMDAYEQKASDIHIEPQDRGIKLRYRIDGELREITQPTFILNGVNDVMVATVNSYYMARNIPNAQLFIYPDAGHAAQFQCPERFLKHAIQFLSE